MIKEINLMIENIKKIYHKIFKVKKIKSLVGGFIEYPVIKHGELKENE